MSEGAASRAEPLQGVRVVNLGSGWAGRVAALLLADQGADVVEVTRPGRIDRLEDALLERGKTVVACDLREPAERAHVLTWVLGADIVFDNLGPGRAGRFGVDHVTVAAANPAAVYVSIPGFSSTSALANVAGWEGTVAASVGVFTDIHAQGSLLGGTPIFSALPMASAYGGVHAAIAAMMGLFHRLRTGQGRHIEVPLADAVLSAMALLVMKVDGQPRRYDLPPIDQAMTEIAFPILRDLQDHLTDEHRERLASYLARFRRPQFGTHRCADATVIFINAVDHVHHSRACLEVLGVLDQLLAEGMIVGSPYEDGGDGNNICNSTGLSERWATRLHAVMAARFATRTAPEWEALMRDAGVPATTVRTTKEWLALPAALAGGNVTDVEDAVFGPVRQPGRFVSIDGPDIASASLRPRSIGAGAAWCGERLSVSPRSALPSRILDGIRVLDLSNVIAGPAAARILAEFGADVIRIDPPAPQAGPRMTMWFGLDVNQGKRAVIIDLKRVEGRAVLARLVERADVVIHNFLDRSAERLGIADRQLRAINPGIVSCQISAWAGPDGGPLKDDPAFDPVLQAATGITSRYGSAKGPVLHGIASCVDYITGFSAALGVTQALVARETHGTGAYVRTSLSMGAQLVQFPFTVASEHVTREAEPTGQKATGYGPHYRQYRTLDGWAFLACRPTDLSWVASLLQASAPSDVDLSERLAQLTSAEASQRLQDLSTASLVPVRRLDALRTASTITTDARLSSELDLAMVRTEHPSGLRVTLPVPSWHRIDGEARQPLGPAPAPGTHTRQVLDELGLPDGDVTALVDTGVIADQWAALRHYLPT